MAKLLSKSVMRWWPDEMVPHNRPAGAVAEARRLWEAAQLYEPFDISQQVAAKYGASPRSCFPHGNAETPANVGSSHTCNALGRWRHGCRGGSSDGPDCAVMTHLGKCGACGHTLQLLCTVAGQVAQKVIGLHN